jgi:hypothetical protein
LILFLCLLGPPLGASSYFVISFHPGISCVWTPLPICDLSRPVKSYFLVLIASYIWPFPLLVMHWHIAGFFVCFLPESSTVEAPLAWPSPNPSMLLSFSLLGSHHGSPSSFILGKGHGPLPLAITHGVEYPKTPLVPDPWWGEYIHDRSLYFYVL